MVHLFFNKSDMGPGMGLAWSFPGGTVVKSSIANAEGSRDKGSFPGLGRSPGKEVATQVSILAWEMPRTEEPGGPEPMRS